MSRLGRGLNSLIKDIEKPTDGLPANVPIEQIRPNRYQPRRHFDPDRLAELAQSIKDSGLIQPIIVSKLNDTEYELIAGERRLQACKLAGLTSIPVFIKNVSDREQLLLAIIENVQRENLTPLEEANAYQRLLDEFSLTHTEISQIIGKDRTTITNTLRLQKLPPTIQEMIANKRLTPGHARAILSVDPALQEGFANELVEMGHSVRKAEELADGYNAQVKKEKPTKYQKLYDKQLLKQIETDIGTALDAHVKIRERKNAAGEIVISFASKEELDELVGRMTVHSG